MTPERWKQIEDLYQAVLEQEPDRRVAFLHSACREDRDLLREVESLLASRTQEQGPETATVVTVPPPVPALVGQQLGHCQVLSLLGKGGMGEVYLARDTQLDRTVALKVLPPELALDPDRLQRFIREAKAASALKHPNIAVIHEIGEAAGTHFIVMEYVEGGTLETRIRDHKLKLGELLDIGIQIADALEEAHRQGITHRDIKPANIMLTPRGQVKVLDFGLAKRARPETAGEGTATITASQTVPGVIMGTLGYMAPEQLLGQSADGRSDLWALGVVLYEMAAGERPFQGQTGFDLSSAILNQSPRPLPAQVPTELRALIEHCLEKAPDRRYQQAGEVRAALEAIRQGTVAPWVAWRYWLARHRWLALANILLLVVAVLVGLDVGGLREWMLGRSGIGGRAIKLAVLPFDNLTGDPAQEYLSDGLTQEMIAQLGRLHPGSLMVTGRGSVMRFKKSTEPPDQIARELGVDYLLEGSARREGSRIRITAELIKARDQIQLWTETYDRELADILALESEVAQKVAETLALKLLPAEQARLANVRTVNPEAHEAYLKGLQHWYKLLPSEIDTAQQYYELALKKDPNYALAHAGLAMAWGARNQMGLTPYSEVAPKTRAAALKAVELDETATETHYVLAGIKTWLDWDWGGGELEFKRAIELNPNFPDARAYYSHLLIYMGRSEEAMAQGQKAVELDPLNSLFRGMWGVDLVCARRYDDAIAEGRQALRLSSPDDVIAQNVLWYAYHLKGMHKEALAAAKIFLNGVYADADVNKAFDGLDAQDVYQGAMRAAAEALTVHFHRSYATPIDVGMLYLFAGDKSRALDWLEKGYELHDSTMPYIAAWPCYDSLRADPRFQALLRRMNLPQ